MTHGTLRPGQSLHPSEAGSTELTVRQPPRSPSESTSTHSDSIEETAT
jgi:hypothetical protein